MRRIVFLVTLTILLSFFASCGAPSGQSSEVKDFTLVSIDGKEISLSDFKGKVVLLVFGFSRCPYCVKEIPKLNKINEKYKNKDFKLVYVNLSEGMEYVKNFVKEAGIKYLTLVDVSGKTAMKYGIIGVPANFLINKSQTKVWMVDIYGNIEERINALLQE